MSLQIATELRPRLSHGADVVVPGDEEKFTSLVSRWREWHAPTVAAVVQVVTEGDIQQAVSNTPQHEPAILGALFSGTDRKSLLSRLPDSICE